MFVDATVFVLLVCCRPRNRFEIIQKMNIRKRRPFQIDPCCCCCWGWPFCCSLFPAVPFWTWLLVCCEHAVDSLRFSVAMMERKDEEIGWVTTPSLVKVRCPSHCCLSRPASFLVHSFLFFFSFLFGCWKWSWHSCSSAELIVNVFNAVPYNRSTTILYSYRP